MILRLLGMHFGMKKMRNYVIECWDFLALEKGYTLSSKNALILNLTGNMTNPRSNEHPCHPDCGLHYFCLKGNSVP